MITAAIYTANQSISGFKITGHAGFAPYGEDIVCAAVSMLAITVANSLEEQVGEVDVQSQDDGMIACTLPGELSKERALKAQAILRTLEIGLEGFNAEYPKHIRLIHQ